MQEPQKIGFALVFDSTVEQALINLQASIVDILDVTPRLSTDINRPHISIMQGKVREGVDLAALWERFLIQAATVWPVPVRFGRIFFKAPGWYFLEIENSPQLVALNRYARDSVVPQLAPLVAPDPNKLKDYTAEEAASYLKYGYRYVDAAFSPHVTLGWNDNVDPDDVLAAMAERLDQGKLPRSTYANALTLYLQGERGAHAQTIFSHLIE